MVIFAIEDECFFMNAFYFIFFYLKINNNIICLIRDLDFDK